MREAKKRNKSCKSNESILDCKQREVQPKQNNSHIYNSANGPIKIKIENVQIGAQSIIDTVLSTNVLDLKLMNCGIVPQECMRLASDMQVSNLRNLDLSYNPIGFQGLCNLLNMKSSKLTKIQHLQLIQCEVDKDFLIDKTIDNIQL